MNKSEITKLLKVNGVSVDELSNHGRNAYTAKFYIDETWFSGAIARAKRITEVLENNGYAVEVAYTEEVVRGYYEPDYYEVGLFIYEPVEVEPERLVAEIKDSGRTIKELTKSQDTAGAYVIKGEEYFGKLQPSPHNGLISLGRGRIQLKQLSVKEVKRDDSGRVRYCDVTVRAYR